MNKEEILQIITAFVLTFVINIPLTQASLSNPKVYGADGINGLVRGKTDPFTFEVTAKIETTEKQEIEDNETETEETLNPELIRLWGTSFDLGFPFTSCIINEVQGGYDCKLENIDLSTFQMCPAVMSDINLYDVDGNLISTTSVQSICDTTSPTISSFSYQREENIVKYSFAILDKADQGGKCSGIATATFSIGAYSEDIEINAEPGKCNYRGEISVDLQNILNSNLRATLTAVDFFDNTGTKTIEFNINDLPSEFIKLRNAKVYGANSIKGFLKSKSDPATFEVKAKIGETTVSPEQIRLEGTSSTSGIAFTSCTKNELTGYFDCKLEGADISTIKVCPIHKFRINMYSLGGQLLKTTEAESICDNNAPAIERFSTYKNTYKASDIINFGVTIKDTSNVPNKCSGLKESLLEIGSYSQYEYIGTEQCSFVKELKVNASSLEEGTLVAKLIAFDNLGSQTTKSISLITDFTAPVASKIEITNTDGSKLGYYIPDSAIKVNIKVTFTESTGISSAKLSIEDLGLRNAEATCTKNECVWSNRAITLLNSSPILVLTTKDLAGNENTEEIEYKFKTDPNPPDIQNIKITGADNTPLGYYIPDKEIYADITIDYKEEETGLVSGFAALNSNDLELIDSKATYCTETQCVWQSIRIKTKNPSPIITVTLKDNGGNINSEDLPYSFVEDTEKPRIGALKVTDSEGNILDWNNGKGVNAIVHVDIVESESGLDESKVMADLSALNNALDYSNLQRTRCSTNGTFSSCKWNVVINAESEDEKQISFTFYAQDRAGNKEQKTLNYNLMVDNTVPIINKLESDSVWKGKYYVGKNTKFTATISEIGVGCNFSNFLLDLNEVGAGNPKAFNCSPQWQCIWKNIKAKSGDETEVTITASGSDNLGNAAAPLSQKFMVDITEPVFVLNPNNQLEIRTLPEYPTYKDTLIFLVNVTERNLVKVEVNTTVISPTGKVQAMDCTEYDLDKTQPYKYECYLEVDDLRTEHTQADVDVIATDAAGNKAVTKYKVVIYTLDTRTEPNFFKIGKVTAIPDFIDKQAASKIPFTVFINPTIEIEDPSGNPQILSKTIDCTKTKHISSYNLMNQYSNNPYISIKTKTTVVSLDDKFKIECNLSLRVKAGNKVYNIPEFEKVEIEIDLKNLPIGTISENVQKKLDITLEEIQDLEDEIETWDNIIGVLKAFCFIGETAAKIDMIITDLLGIYQLLSCALVPVSDVGGAIWPPVCKGSMTVHGIITKWFWNPDLFDFSSKGYYPGMWIKWACYITHGRLCDANLWGQLGGNAVSYGMASLISKMKTSTNMDEDQINSIARTNENLANFYYEKADNFYADDNKVMGDYWEGIADEQMKTAESIRKSFEQKENADPKEVKDTSIRQQGIQDYQSRYVRPWQYDEWDYIGEVTTLLDYPNPADWDMDPYKSKYYAKRCLHFPAYVYNLEKERQIKCRYWRCLNDAGTNTALPITTCDIMQREMNCLYVESAYFPFQKFNWFNWTKIYKNIIVVITGNMLGIGTGEVVDIALNDGWDSLEKDPWRLLDISLGALCTALGKGEQGAMCAEPCTSFPSVVCVMEQALRGYRSFKDIVDNGFDMTSYEDKLDDVDYCEGVA